MEEALVLGGALVAGLGLGAAAVFAARSLRRRRDVVSHEIVMEEPSQTIEAAPTASAWDEQPFTVAKPLAGRPREGPAAAPARPRMAPPPEPAPPARPPPVVHWTQRAPPKPQPVSEEITSEWARRQVGPVQPGRTKGVCSGCGTMLSVSLQRPLRVTCSVCGRTRLLT